MRRSEASTRLDLYSLVGVGPLTTSGKLCAGEKDVCLEAMP